jgi:nucleotide-binding universal stress UspA family protein
MSIRARSCRVPAQLFRVTRKPCAFEPCFRSISDLGSFSLRGLLLAEPHDMTFERILVATDFSECAEHAVSIAAELALQFDSELTLVTSWEIPPASYGATLYFPGDIATPIHDASQKALDHAGDALKKQVPRAKTMLREGEAWQEILSGAEAVHADLIIVGTHGRRGLGRAFLGSVAERVVRMSRVPVLSVHTAQSKT